MRLFLAVEAPASDRYASLTQGILAAFPHARPVPPGQWHATLRFLGEVPDPAPVVETVRPIVAQLRPAPLSVHGLGAFPNASRARVLWAGMHADGLETLAAALADALPVPREPEPRRPFRPHVTLARLDPPRDVRSFVETTRDVRFGEGTWSEVFLFRSDLRPGGPVYTRLESFPLAGPGAAHAPRRGTF